MKIALSAGHNVINNGYFDNGAISPDGKIREGEITKKTVALLKPMLEARGHQVYDVTPYNKRFNSGGGKKASRKAHDARSEKIKQINPDLYLDIHVNAGGGTGPETIVYSTKSKAYPHAKKITEAIAKETGLTNRRGVKINTSFWALTLHPHPSIIVEGAFIDSPGGKDMKMLTPERYAKAIASCFGEIKKPSTGNHWAKKHVESLNKKGITIHEERYDDNITRGELFALLDRVVK